MVLKLLLLHHIWLGGSVIQTIFEKNAHSEVAEVGPEDILTAIQKGTIKRMNME